MQFEPKPLLPEFVAESPRRFAKLSDTAVVLLACAVLGCQTGPFAPKERTTLTTPAMRMAAIEEMGARAERADEAAQLQLCEQLVAQIQTEPDPIVRKTIQKTIAQVDHPLALEVLTAGLDDEDREVRLTCCRWLGRRGDRNSVSRLARLLKSDADVDVRLAAVDALGQIKVPESVSALATALNDRDPAMQYAGVEAARLASGEELGNDVQVWRQYVASIASPDQRATSVAEGPTSNAKF